ncbi:hypothetical protein [Peribacillus butanolivorans]|uniref:hypothetical protein n=1 Tax=Peribacillus butanolivorans TaxID=421767 RepID=UPI00367324D2
MGIGYQELFNKSKVFIDKAIKRRDEEDFEEFQLWASVSLELLGKATLASIHPSLVVDPNKPKGFLVACGQVDPKDLKSEEFKTITAKTVFDRLSNTINVPKFDSKAKDFCMTLANRRNAELHSALIPFTGVDIEAWLPRFWEVCQIMLEFQGKTLKEFLGDGEAARATSLITDQTQYLKGLIEARIIRCKEFYLERQQDRREIIYTLDEWEEIVDCPSCGNEGVVEGEQIDREYKGVDPENPWITYFNEIYDVTTFRCSYCELKLTGYKEIELAGMETEFEKEVDDHPDYDSDYGND